MEKRDEIMKKYVTYKSPNRSFYSYNGNNWKSWYNRHLGSFSNINFNRSRDKNVKSNSKVACLIHVDHQNRRLECRKEAAPWSEEALELERKQQVSDTANKLMNKLKLWSTEKDKGSDVSCKGMKKRALPVKPEEKQDQMKRGRFNKADQRYQCEKVKNVSGKSAKETVTNHENVSKRKSSSNIQSISKLEKSQRQVTENKQKIIQQSIIGELITMPKENLNRVLINPNIHPRIENKMAQLVKENRLIIAQKFRNLAESKMNCPGQFQSKFVDDVENLLDPDLAVDLCQLPPELIKQIGDIFQLDFHGCLKNTELKGSTTDSCDLETVREHNDEKTMNSFDIDGMDLNEGSQQVNVKQERGGKISVKNFANLCNKNGLKIGQQSVTNCNSRSEFPSGEESLLGNIHNNTIRNKTSESFQDSNSNDLIKASPTTSQFNESFSETQIQLKERIIEPEHSPEHDVYHYSNRGKPSNTERRECCNYLNSDLNFESKSSEAQTDISLIDLDYTKLLENGRECVERSLLLQEVDVIDNLIHVLNQRRFLLFLKLVNLSSCKSGNSLKNRLVKVITNDDEMILKEKKKRRKSDCKKKVKRKKEQDMNQRKEASDVHQEIRHQINEITKSPMMITEPATDTIVVKKEYI